MLYPQGLPPAQRLPYYFGQFQTVELNASFYRWPANQTFASWRRRLPDGFRMAVKAPRGLTHGRRLYGPEKWIERITAGLHELRGRRGPLLVQLPPDMARDDVRLAYFLERVPDWIDVAVELRHQSWHVDEVFDLLAKNERVAGKIRELAQLLETDQVTAVERAVDALSEQVSQSVAEGRLVEVLQLAHAIREGLSAGATLNTDDLYDDQGLPR